MTDKREFERIFRQHYDGMFRLARRMLGDDAESKDVVSDVFAYSITTECSDWPGGCWVTTQKARMW